MTPEFKRTWTKLEHDVRRKVLDIIRSSPQPHQVEAQVTIVYAYLVETYPEDISTLQIYSSSFSSHHHNNDDHIDPFTIQVHNASTQSNKKKTGESKDSSPPPDGSIQRLMALKSGQTATILKDGKAHATWKALST